MSETAGLKVRDLLPTRLNGMEKAVTGEIRRDADLKLAGFPLPLSGEIADRTAEEVTKVLDVDVIGLLAHAWAKAWELHEYSLGAGKHPPEEVTTLSLGKHELSQELRPAADLRFGAISKVTLEFVIELAAKLEEAQLTVTRGRIVRVGECRGSVSAQFKFAGVPLHDELESKSLPLTPSFALPGNGIEIP